MKKFLALLLAVCMVLCMFAGCQRNTLEDEDEQNQQNNQSQNEGPAPVATQPPVVETQPPVIETEPAPVVYDSYFKFYDYSLQDYINSDVATYHAVTGSPCELSSFDFRFLEEDYEYTVVGYDDRYGVYIYDFVQSDFNEYVNYLESRGFECVQTQGYSQGTSYFYKNYSTGLIFDLFVSNGNGFIAIEPFLNRDLT